VTRRSRGFSKSDGIVVKMKGTKHASTVRREETKGGDVVRSAAVPV